MPSYSTDALVCGKTKLGESDLIITLLVADGSLVRAVAKGARKPRSKLGGTVEMFSQVNLLLARGRNLDIVVEAQSVDPHDGCRLDLEHSAAASVICEALSKLALQGQEQGHLYDMSIAALSAIDRSITPRQDIIVAADLLKTLCLLGYRPSFLECVGCGVAVEAVPDSQIGFSYSGGGVVCNDCPNPPADKIMVSSNLIIWLITVLNSTFADLLSRTDGEDVTPELLRFCESWLLQNTGVRLRSFSFLFLQ